MRKTSPLFFPEVQTQAEHPFFDRTLTDQRRPFAYHRPSAAFFVWPECTFAALFTS
jgi:hypothetical protein